MGLFHVLKDVFESIFMSSSPEVRKKLELRRIENELRAFQPSIYKNEQLLPNFAEIFRLLYENTKPIENILSETICTEDLRANGRYEYQLMLTGFSSEMQQKLEQLNYTNRKNEVVESEKSLNKVLEAQRRAFEVVLRQLGAQEFKFIDESMARLQQLSDICRFNYINIIHAFDPNFDGFSSVSLGSGTKPVMPAVVSAYIQDLYYLTANFKIDTSVARAVVALYELQRGTEPTQKEKDNIMANLRKISSILTKMLTPEILKKIVCLAKKDASFTPQTASYTASAVKRFTEFIQGRFDSDENRIKNEIKDYTISFELKELFGDTPLQEFVGYNAATNDLLRQNTPYSFMWITPLQTLKSFLSLYFSEQVKVLLNNIVIEGFFNNSNYKSEFSSSVYTCSEMADRIAAFEKTFEHGGENDEANIVGLVNDCRRDSDFLKLLGASVDKINTQAHKIVQEESSNLFSLYKQIGELIVDSKKSKSEMISNIKVLMSSTRNRDGSGILEQQRGAWKTFLKIMKNYAIIGELDDKHE